MTVSALSRKTGQGEELPISTGPLEGINDKIKVLKRQAYGLRDIDYFQLRLFFIHEAVPAFPG
jgi:transposase